MQVLSNQSHYGYKGDEGHKGGEGSGWTGRNLTLVGEDLLFWLRSFNRVFCKIYQYYFNLLPQIFVYQYFMLKVKYLELIARSLECIVSNFLWY